MNQSDQIQKYDFHRSLFGIEKTFISSLFEDSFLYNSINYAIEPSITIEDENIYSNRFYIYYMDPVNLIDNATKSIKWIDNVSDKSDLCIDKSLLNKVLFGNVLSAETNIRCLIAGYDIRDQSEYSRIKWCIDINGDSRALLNIIILHGSPKEVLKFTERNRLLFMVEMRGDGDTRLKVYPVITKPNEDHIQIFSKNVYKILARSKQTFISFDRNMNRILNLFIHANNEKTIIDHGLGILFDNSNFKEIFKSLCRKYKIRCISLKEKEFDRGEIRKINLYY